MKCIQAIKETKYSKVGEIKRVSESEANEKVDIKYWKFVPKSEWKSTKKVSLDQILREQYPANVEASKEFNKVNKKK